MLECPHIVETVCQLDQNNPDILRHGHQHLTVIFCQLLLVGFVLDLTQLGDPIYDHAHIRPKLSFQIIQCRTGILNHIMQEAAGDRYRVQLERGQNPCHLNRMHNIRLTWPAKLPTVTVNRIDQSFLYKGHILRSQIFSRKGQYLIARQIHFFWHLVSPIPAYYFITFSPIWKPRRRFI